MIASGMGADSNASLLSMSGGVAGLNAGFASSNGTLSGRSIKRSLFGIFSSIRVCG